VEHFFLSIKYWVMVRIIFWITFFVFGYQLLSWKFFYSLNLWNIWFSLPTIFVENSLLIKFVKHFFLSVKYWVMVIIIFWITFFDFGYQLLSWKILYWLNLWKIFFGDQLLMIKILKYCKKSKLQKYDQIFSLGIKSTEKTIRWYQKKKQISLIQISRIFKLIFFSNHYN